ncbi:hypothetical protein E2C01_035128 [Portunus trituberculatus]|uniref:Uncharacterized protein n=1 Tax=Portunus trituberculatus TaxID=210409 RepID=A0A5B7F8I0_PORTR|nr:hypothetical protein [Portunus trituberculatus]
MLAEQRVAQTKWLKGTFTLRSDRFRERSDITREPRGLPRSHQGTTKFEFKSQSMHSVVRGHPTAKSEFCQAEICQKSLTGPLWCHPHESSSSRPAHPHFTKEHM